jgi:ribosomal protein S18 acetylase RimI-like enzyme
MEIRTATLEDTEQVLALWDDVVEHRTLGDRAEDVQRLLVRDPEALLVAAIDGRIVGTVIAGWDGWRGTIWRLAVANDVRRRGIATALVEEAERRLEARGCQRVSLIVISQEEAPEFWRSAGYEVDSSATRFVRNLT